jgi:hypothetical protein
MLKIPIELIMPLVAVFIIVAAVIYYKLKARFKKGELIQTILVDNRLVMVTSLNQGSGGRLSSTARGTNYIRLKIVDTETGQSLGKKILSPQYEIRMAVNGVCWFSLNRARYQERADQSLIGLDLVSLREVFDEAQLKKALGIAPKASFSNMSFDQESAAILITDASGFKHSFNCANLHASGITRTTVLPYESAISERIERLNKFHFEKMPNSERYQLFYDKKAVHKNQSFVNPICLFTSEQENALVFFHQGDLSGQSESYLSDARTRESIVSEIQILTAASKTKLGIALAGETNNHFFVSTRNANRDVVLAIDKSSATLSWVSEG